MPAMYPEELRDLRTRHPELQYDFRGNVVGTSPMYEVNAAAADVSRALGGYQQPNAWDFGPTRNDYLNSKDFVGPLPQQWWDPNGELAQRGLGALVSGQDLPDVGFYSQWNPDTNSWVRHGAPSGAYRQPGSGGAARPQNPYARQQNPDVQNMRQPGLHADVQGIIADAAENKWDVDPLQQYTNKWGVNPLYPYTYAYKGYGAPYPYDHDDGSGEYTPGV